MLKNIGSNWALNVLQILVFMVLSPFVVRTLGQDVNGVWQSIVALAGPLQLLILGVPMASVRFITENLSKGDREGTNAAVSTCLAICLIMGVVALVTGTGLYFLFEHKYLSSESWAGLTAQTTADARIAFVVFVLTVTMGFAARLPYGIFEAHHDFVRRNLVVGGGFLLKLALTLILLSHDASLVLLAIVQITCMLTEFAVALWVVRRNYPEISFGLRAFDRSMVRRILSFSIFAMLLNVGAQLAFRTDALVIGWFESPGDVTTYDIGNKIFEPFTNLVLGIGMVVMPLATALHAKGQTADLGAVLSKWTKISFTLVLAIGIFLLVLGPEFLAWWFGDDYDPQSGSLLQVLMVSFLIFLPVRGVALPILMGLGKPGRPAIGLLGMGLLNLLLSVALIGPYGLMGVALGTAIPNVLFAGFVFLTACRQLDLKPMELALYSAGRALLGALPATLLLLIIKWNLSVDGFLQLTLAGIAFVLMFALAQVLFVFKGDAHLDLHALIMRRLRAARGEGN
ncbi:MAG: O-antigen/teichoic acid export membrane protein [Chlamydiales bacterium]|jgi:O-antigen/teichoic acid export membrane protein